MQKIILSVVLAAFAVSAQAGDDKGCGDKEKTGSCCTKSTSADQAKSASQSKTECSVSTTTKAAKSSCCMEGAEAKASKEGTTKVALVSPKAAADAAK